MGKLQIKLNKNAFAKAKEKAAEEFGDASLEPGRYDGTVVAVRTPKADMVIIEVNVPEANDGAGGKVGIWYSLNPDRVHWLIRDVAKFGYDIDSPEELTAALEEIAASGAEVRVRAREKDGNVNVNLDRVLGEGGGDSDDSAVDEDAGKPSAGAKAGSPKEKAGKAKPKPKAEPEEEEAVDEEEAVEEAEEAVEEDEPVADEEQVEIAPGLKCKATIKNVKEKVEVCEINEAEEKIMVKVLKTGKKFWVPLSKLEI